jgi:multisubunit Na+/H+ antiporter MnhG subunit
MVGWPEAIALLALAIIVVAIVVLIRGPELVSAWARSAYEHETPARHRRVRRART